MGSISRRGTTWYGWIPREVREEEGKPSLRGKSWSWRRDRAPRSCEQASARSQETPQLHFSAAVLPQDQQGGGKYFVVGDWVVPGQSEMVIPVEKDTEVHTLCLLEGVPGDDGGEGG